MKKQSIKVLAVSFILLVLLVWIYNRWDLWLKPRVEPNYIIKEGVQNLQLTFGNENGAEERVVSWVMNKNDSAIRLKYVYSASSDTIEIKPRIYHFSKEIDSLDILNAYYYNASIPTERNGTYYYTVDEEKWYNFDIVEKDSFTVLCLGDIQNVRLDTTSVFDSICKFAKPDFIIQSGDLVERPYFKYWDIYFNDFKSITPHIPMLATLGNHDYGKFPQKKPDVRFFYTFPYLFKNMPDVEKSACFTLKYGNVYFHIFDSNRFLPSLITQAREFKQKKFPKNAYHVAVMHHPPYSEKSIWNNIDVRIAFVQIFDEVGIDLVIAGHEHLFGYREACSKSGVSFNQSVLHFSRKNYSKTEQNTRAFAILKYKKEKLTYCIYDENFNLKFEAILEK